jgi:hypothetical protein
MFDSDATTFLFVNAAAAALIWIYVRPKRRWWTVALSLGWACFVLLGLMFLFAIGGDE